LECKQVVVYKHILIHTCLPDHTNFLSYDVESFKSLQHPFLVICNLEVKWEIHKPFFLQENSESSIRVTLGC
jgi:hypothetical protein